MGNAVFFMYQAIRSGYGIFIQINAFHLFLLHTGKGPASRALIFFHQIKICLKRIFPTFLRPFRNRHPDGLRCMRHGQNQNPVKSAGILIRAVVAARHLGHLLPYLLPHLRIL